MVEFFRVAKKVAEEKSHSYIMQNGGINEFFYNGRKNTEKIEIELILGPIQYRFSILELGSPAGSFMIDDKKVMSCQQIGPVVGGVSPLDINQNQEEQVILTAKDSFEFVNNIVTNWQIFHLNDTSKTAQIRHTENVIDDTYLRGDAANLAPFLLKLKNHHPESYEEIINAIRLVMPYFDDFQLDIKDFGKGKEINLAWTQKGSDYPLSPFHLSDGSIRFIALATALLQPNPPSTIIIDEPELGLHPSAIHILSELINSASRKTQVVVATQSPMLLDSFAVKDIVVVNRENGASTFKRLNDKDYDVWLEEYSIGELWTKNVISSGPNYE